MLIVLDFFPPRLLLFFVNLISVMMAFRSLASIFHSRTSHPTTALSLVPCFLLIAISVSSCSAQAVAEHPTALAAMSLAASSDEGAQLGPEDMVEVTVYNVPELTTKARVGSKGDLYLPLVGYVHVGGLKAEEAEAVIEKKLSDGGFVKEPHVSVLISQQGARGASVLGQVSRPGVYPVTGAAKLFDLISAAGGLTEKAGLSVTVTHRDNPDKPEIVQLARNLEDKPESNVPVLPGDTVIVRKADIVYVVGEVGRPSGLLMESGRLTVLQAVALSGGTTRTAKLSGVRIIRQSTNGITETPVDLRKILSAKAPDMPMVAEDILFVPTSTGKVIMGRSAEAALQAATAVSIVAVP